MVMPIRTRIKIAILRIMERALGTLSACSFLAMGSKSIARRLAMVTGIKKDLAKYKPPIIKNPHRSNWLILVSFSRVIMVSCYVEIRIHWEKSLGKLGFSGKAEDTGEVDIQLFIRKK